MLVEKHVYAAIQDAYDCALAGQFDTARALLDHAEELATCTPALSGQATHLMQFMDAYEQVSYTAHLTEMAA